MAFRSDSVWQSDGPSCPRGLRAEVTSATTLDSHQTYDRGPLVSYHYRTEGGCRLRSGEAFLPSILLEIESIGCVASDEKGGQT
jgi:hypothetical protein